MGGFPAYKPYNYIQKEVANVKKRILSFLLLSTVIILSCGCSLSMSIDSLLTPPKLSEEQTEIYQALISSTGKVSLKYPKSGDYRSAFVMYDLDDEPTDEALVFYETVTSTGISSLRVNFLDQDENANWRSVYDLPATGTDIEKVTFKRLGDEDTMNIIIGYSMLNSSDKVISVLQYKDGTAEEVYTNSFTVMDLLDINANGNLELLLISQDKAIPKSSFRAITMENETPKTLYNVALDPSANEYLKLSRGYIAGYTQALFIDYSKTDSTYGTDIVYLSGQKLVNAVYNAQNTPNSPSNASSIQRRTNIYTPVVYSQDINGDGVTETAGTVPLPGYENLTLPEQMYAFAWYSVEDGNLKKVAYTYISPKSEFLMTFPGRWEGFVTATYDSITNQVDFYQYSTGLDNLSQCLLSVRIISKTDQKYASYDTQNYTYFGSSNDNDFYISQDNPLNPLSLTEDELAVSLKIINQLTDE